MKTLVNNKIDGEGDPTRSRYTYQEKVVWLKKTFKKKHRNLQNTIFGRWGQWGEAYAKATKKIVSVPSQVGRRFSTFHHPVG